jgi:diacylglycerol kinase family enzyme
VKPTRPVFVVINARSGRKAVRDRIEALRAGFAAACGHAPQLFIARSGRHVPAVAAAAVAQAHREHGVLVVAGGDGTINAVGQVALAQQVPFGIVPGGTFNLLSRTHGIPQDTEDAIRTIAAGVIRPVQAAMVNDRIFFVNASVGLYPQLLEDREAYKQRLGRSRMVAAWSALVTLCTRSHRLDLELDADGRRWRQRTPTLFVGNNRLQLEQVGIEEADCVEQGRLLALTSQPLDTLAAIRLMARGAVGRLGDAPEVRSFTFERLTVAPARPAMRSRIKVATDGEILSLRPPLVFRPSPQALQLIVPAATPETAEDEAAREDGDRAEGDREEGAREKETREEAMRDARRPAQPAGHRDRPAAVP